MNPFIGSGKGEPNSVMNSEKAIAAPMPMPKSDLVPDSVYAPLFNVDIAPTNQARNWLTIPWRKLRKI